MQRGTNKTWHTETQGRGLFFSAGQPDCSMEETFFFLNAKMICVVFKWFVVSCPAPIHEALRAIKRKTSVVSLCYFRLITVCHEKWLPNMGTSTPSLLASSQHSSQ